VNPVSNIVTGFYRWLLEDAVAAIFWCLFVPGFCIWLTSGDPSPLAVILGRNRTTDVPFMTCIGLVPIREETKQNFDRGYVCLETNDEFLTLTNRSIIRLRDFSFIINPKDILNVSLKYRLSEVGHFLRLRSKIIDPVKRIVFRIHRDTTRFCEQIPIDQVSRLLELFGQVRGLLEFTSSPRNPSYDTWCWLTLHDNPPPISDENQHLGRLIINWPPLFHPALINPLACFINSSLVSELTLDTYISHPFTLDQMSTSVVTLLSRVSSPALVCLRIGGNVSLEGLSQFLRSNPQLLYLYIGPRTVIPSDTLLEDDCDTLQLVVLHGSLYVCHRLLIRYNAPHLRKISLESDIYNNHRMEGEVIYDVVSRAAGCSSALNSVAITLPPFPDQAAFLLDIRPRNIQTPELNISTTVDPGAQTRDYTAFRRPLDSTVLLRVGPWLASFGTFERVLIWEGGDFDRADEFQALVPHVGNRDLELISPDVRWFSVNGVTKSETYQRAFEDETP